MTDYLKIFQDELTKALLENQVKDLEATVKVLFWGFVVVSVALIAALIALVVK